MRELNDHKTNVANSQLTILATDEPGAGGAYHRYVIGGFDAANNSSLVDGDCENQCVIPFQNGAIPEVGVNGVTQEALLAVLIDRLRAFQFGPFACRENALALTNLEQALHYLHSRTRAREQRGVEGTHAV